MARASSPSLHRYRQKRDFSRTPEPAGIRRPLSASPAPIFVVQKHAATRLHYDFRLELDGTLKSWAVPKGPSLDPADKRLAVHVEDHPLDYAAFEGIIPPKQYGAGTVLIWDRGTWHPEGDPRDGYRKGLLKFRLDGLKLRGNWMLVRMHRRGEESGDNWLLLKERDQEARRGEAGAIVERLPNSAASGLSVEAVAASAPRIWQSNRKRAMSGEWRALAPHHSPLTTASVPGAVKAAQPDWIAPQLATLVDRMPGDDGWIYEIKYDGYRILSRVSPSGIELFSRNRHDWTAKLRAQAEAVAQLGLETAWLDGEMVVFTEKGATDFQALQNAFDHRFTGHIVYCLFDLLYLNGYDLRSVQLVERKRVLHTLLSGERGPLLRYSDHVVGTGELVHQEACRQGLEGIIAKRADSLYLSKRSRTWLKIKCDRRQEFVVGGYSEPTGSRQGFGALLVGYYEGTDLRYAGRVGTGYSEALLRRLHRTLRKLETSRSPFIDPPTGFDARGVHWVKPKLVMEVRFAEWTKEGILRQPSFQGLRTDKDPRQVLRERPGSPAPVNRDRAVRTTVRRSSAPAVWTRRGTLRFTNPDRVLYPDIGLTKAGLARYYETVARWMLPHVQGRPLTLLRCPEGYQECFYQKHVNERVPAAVTRILVQEQDTRDTYMVANNLDALLGLVQMGVLELHTWGATSDRLERPDRLTFDLDPDPSVPWSHVVEAARLLKTLLEELGLSTFVKTTGGKGLHVVVPIQRHHTWEEVKHFSKAVADHMVRTIPTRFTANMAKRVRTGKIFIDYLRNARGATAIAAYSPRARPGAPVSVPLTWHELSDRMRSDHYTVMSLGERLAALHDDPWSGYDGSARRLTETMRTRLGTR